MILKFKEMISTIKKFIKRENGMSSVEAAMTFPIMLTFLLGVFEIGMGITSNQKAIRAAQIAADLLSRERVVETADINEALEAARQAILPLDDGDLGIDVVSVEFQEDSAGNEVINTLWRETQNMTQDPQVLNDVSGLGDSGEGALAVVVQFRYVPVFSQVLVDTIEMREVAFVRSRKSSIITRIN